MKAVDLKKQLNSGDISNVYLFCGEEEYLKGKYLEMMYGEFEKSGFAELNVTTLEFNNYSLKDMDNLLEQMPVMADKKLVVIKDSNVFTVKTKRGYSDYCAYWKEKIKDIPEYTCLVFVETEIDKRSAVYKYVQKEYDVVEFDLLSDSDMIKWVTKLTAQHSKKFEDISDFVARCDKGMAFVYNEVMKLIEYVGEHDVITKADVELMVTKTLNSYIFDIIDAIIVKNGNEACVGVKSLYEQKESPISILANLSASFGKILKTKYALQNGGGYPAVCDALNEKRSFIVNKYINFAKKFSIDGLLELIELSSQCDVKLKRSVIKAEEEFMLFVLNILTK